MRRLDSFDARTAVATLSWNGKAVRVDCTLLSQCPAGVGELVQVIGEVAAITRHVRWSRALLLSGIGDAYGRLLRTGCIGTSAD